MPLTLYNSLVKYACNAHQSPVKHVLALYIPFMQVMSYLFYFCDVYLVITDKARQGSVNRTIVLHCIEFIKACSNMIRNTFQSGSYL